MLLTHWGEGADAPAPTHDPDARRSLERSAEAFDAMLRERSHLVEQMVSWMGPLPPPGAVREYEEILPGTCERMLALTERQADHRQWIEREAVRSASVVEQRGQAIAALIGVLAIVCGTYLMATNHDGWGFATIVTAIAGLVGASVFSRRLQGHGVAGESGGNDAPVASGPGLTSQ